MAYPNESEKYIHIKKFYPTNYSIKSEIDNISYIKIKLRPVPVTYQILNSEKWNRRDVTGFQSPQSHSITFLSILDQIADESEKTRFKNKIKDMFSESYPDQNSRATPYLFTLSDGWMYFVEATSDRDSSAGTVFIRDSDLQQSGAGTKPTSRLIHILHRDRKVTKQGRTSYIRYKHKLISITDARKLEREINKSRKSRKS